MYTIAISQKLPQQKTYNEKIVLIYCIFHKKIAGTLQN